MPPKKIWAIRKPLAFPNVLDRKEARLSECFLQGFIRSELFANANSDIFRHVRCSDTKGINVSIYFIFN